MEATASESALANGRVSRRPAPYVVRLFLLSSLCLGSGGCAPQFWQGFSQGLAQSQGGYYGSPSSSANKVQVCVRYLTDAGWSHGYSVTGTVISGSELNTRTRTLNYDALATYVVVFWGQGEASVLRLDAYFGSISALGQSAVDQYGRQWQVASGSVCY